MGLKTVYFYYPLAPLRALSVRLCCYVGCFSLAVHAFAQAAPAKPKTPPDVLIFNNGDQLTGQLERSDGSSVVFKSDMAGEITLDWSKIKELHTNRQFAVLPKNVRLKRGENPAHIPQGNIEVSNGKIEVTPTEGAAPQSIPTADSAHVVDRPTFEQAIGSRPNLLQDWTGSISLGTTLVEATQKNNTLSGAVNLLRAEPVETWLDRRTRTTVDFNFAYGTLTQPNTPEIKTDLWHFDAERDEYLNQRVFAFGAVAYDHNFSQGLNLQQTYGGGFGWTVIKDAVQEFDLKASMNYVEEQFSAAAQSQNLIGSTFAENYNRKLIHGIVFTEQGAVTPAWNNPNAYSATGQAGLNFPVYKRFSLSLTSLDTFINNPPPGFKKNSFQFTTALGYTLK